MKHRVAPHNAASETVEVAKNAKLHYVDDSDPGISREKLGRSFRYLGLRGKPIKNRRTLARIDALVIPPAWTQVWICPDPNGHLQATGRDARRRKQYLYHPRWREIRDGNKYQRLMEFALALPRIRRRVSLDLRRRGLSRETVLAAIVRLLEATLIRVGNDEYAKANHSFGLTTMRDRHAAISGSTIHFDFNGKSGVHHEIEVQDSQLARLVKHCQELPGQRLFQFTDQSGARHSIGSNDVNDYLKGMTGLDFTAKDFRTWAGTVLAVRRLKEAGDFDSLADGKRRVKAAVSQVADDLGNTPAVCRRCYIHPAVIAAYLNHTLTANLTPRRSRQSHKRLGLHEREALHLLEQSP